MNTSPITSQAPAVLRRSPSAVHRKADPLAGQVLADGLRVSAPSDPLEREAEATASRVMRMQAPAKAGRAPAGELQRACASCGGKKDKAAHRKPASVQRAPAAIASQGGSGSALPDGVRADMEGRFGGQDFSGVRVHAGPQANTLARSYNARAFTMGSDIYFGQGEYSPSSKGGQHLLAHELTHVVQGGGGHTLSRDPTRANGASTNWAIRPTYSGSAHLGAGLGGTVLFGTIKNRDTGEARSGRFIGPSVGVGTVRGGRRSPPAAGGLRESSAAGQASLSPSWSNFRTGDVCTLSDFDGTYTTVTMASAGLGAGYGLCYIRFPFRQTRAIPAHGFLAGAIGLDASTSAGVWTFNRRAR